MTEEVRVIIQPAPEIRTTIAPRPSLVGSFGALQGPSGPPGVDAGFIEKRAVGALSALRVVCAVDGDHVVAASALVRDHAYGLLGVSVTSASGAEERVKIVSVGELEDASWAFEPLRNVVVGAAGELTQTTDASWAFACVIGVAVSATKVWIKVRPPTFMARREG